MIYLANFFSIFLISIGLFFLCIAAIGAIRLPDFYTRSHAIGVTDTLGTLLILNGLIIQYGLSVITAKIIFLFVFIYLANPAVTHVLLRAALRSGLQPWTLEKLKK